MLTRKNADKRRSRTALPVDGGRRCGAPSTAVVPRHNTSYIARCRSAAGVVWVGGTGGCCQHFSWQYCKIIVSISVRIVLYFLSVL